MRTLAVRLPPGCDLRAELARLTADHALKAGCILTGVGSLSRARLRLPGAVGQPEAFADFEEPMEILSLAGTLSPEGMHVHLVLGRADGACVGGHLVAGCIVATTAEVVVGELDDFTFRRPLDETTGYGELSVERRER